MPELGSGGRGWGGGGGGGLGDWGNAQKKTFFSVDVFPNDIDSFYATSDSTTDGHFLGLVITIHLYLFFQQCHFWLRAMGAISLRISELCLSFSPHPNISDRNSNLVHHFILVQIFQINGEERESKRQFR